MLITAMWQSIKIKDLFQTDVRYTFIICTHQVDGKVLSLVEEYSRTYKIPTIFINSAGFYSYFSIHMHGSFPIVDTHPDSTATTDLRLLSPWPELLSFAQEMTAEIDELDAHTHGHIPYIVLLLHYLEEWKKHHAGKAPETYSEKISFRKMVAEGARTNNPEGGEENYDEAVAAVLKTIAPPTLSSSVKEVFDYTPSEVSSSRYRLLRGLAKKTFFLMKVEANSSFWIITDAVKKFYAQNKVLPLPGSIPDMKAQSEVYIRLQNVYKAKARKDVAEVERLVKFHPQGCEVDVQEIEAYCKNAAFVKLIRRAEPTPNNLKALAGKYT